MRVMSIPSEAESRIRELAESILRQENEALLRLIKSRCPYCRYAKTCNPKKRVEGFSIRYEASGDPIRLADDPIRLEARFARSKGKSRKDPIPFEETRISKIAKCGE